jgi:dTDP-4-dehydrorhamnose 3,5-epimerase
LSETADTSYRINRRHDPSEDLTVAWDDPQLAVEWPLPPSVMSENDRTAAPLSELADRLALIRAETGAAT